MRDWLRLQMPNAFPDPIPTTRAPQQLTHPRPQGTSIYMQILTPGVAPTTAHTHECKKKPLVAHRCQTCRQAFPLAAGGQHNHPCLRAVGEHMRATPHTPGLRDRPGTTTAQRRHAHELTKATILRGQQATTPHRDCQRQGRKSRPESDCAHRALRRCEPAPAGLKYKRLAGRPG